MSIDFGGIVTAIKTIIGSGFRYEYAHNWVSIESGEIPNAQLNRAYTIRPTGIEESGDTNYTTQLSLDIEFCLDAKNDLYLAMLDDAFTKVKALAGITHTDILRADGLAEPNFRASYYPSVVLVVFPINILIRST